MLEVGSHCNRYRVLLLAPLTLASLDPSAANPCSPPLAAGFCRFGVFCFWLCYSVQLLSFFLPYCCTCAVCAQTTVTKAAMGLTTCVFNSMLGVTLGIRCPLNKKSWKCLNSVFLNYFIRCLKGKVISML